MNHKITKLLFLASLAAAVAFTFSGCGGGGAASGKVSKIYTEPPLVVSVRQQVSAGYEHTCVLKADGTVKCWGNNTNGQLGNGTPTGDYSTIPATVREIGNAAAISAGIYHTCALLNDGTAKCWGDGSDGQLGNGLASYSTATVTVNGITNATAISAGYRHTCALLSDGTVKCWGFNAFGQLGNGTTSNSTTPVAVSGISNATAISAGRYYHTCALLGDGTVKCWGNNQQGQLGNGTTTNSTVPVNVSGVSGAVSISLSLYHTCAALRDGTAKCWGQNNSGQLGNGTRTDSTIPVAVDGIGNATAISVGYYTACALLNDGTVKCWGDNSDGQLGNGSASLYSTTPDAVTALSAVTGISGGIYHSCALLGDGTVKCWGYNQHGQLGDGTTTDSATPVAVTGL